MPNDDNGVEHRDLGRCQNTVLIDSLRHMMLTIAVSLNIPKKEGSKEVL